MFNVSKILMFLLFFTFRIVHKLDLLGDSQLKVVFHFIFLIHFNWGISGLLGYFLPIALICKTSQIPCINFLD